MRQPTQIDMSTCYRLPRIDTGPMLYDVSLLTDDDLHLFNEGTHYDLWKKLGAHVVRNGEVSGTYFAVWAPNAKSVSVIGDFNDWDKDRTSAAAARHDQASGKGSSRTSRRALLYKYHIVSHVGGYAVDKADPFAFRHETPPRPGVGRLGARLRLERRGVDGIARRAQSARRADVDLRGAHRLVAAESHRRAIARSTIASWRSTWPTMCGGWASRMSSSCR